MTMGPDFTNIQNLWQWLRDRTRPISPPPTINYDALLVNVLNLVNETLFGPGYPAFPSEPIIANLPSLEVAIESWSDLQAILEDATDALYPDQSIWSLADEYPADIGGEDQ